jgi:hypothetical protein
MHFEEKKAAWADFIGKSWDCSNSTVSWLDFWKERESFKDSTNLDYIQSQKVCLQTTRWWFLLWKCGQLEKNTCTR